MIQDFADEFSEELKPEFPDAKLTHRAIDGGYSVAVELGGSRAAITIRRLTPLAISAVKSRLLEWMREEQAKRAGNGRT